MKKIKNGFFKRNQEIIEIRNNVVIGVYRSHHDYGCEKKKGSPMFLLPVSKTRLTEMGFRRIDSEEELRTIFLTR